MKLSHLLYCPFTGLGLFNGFRGNLWLKNRIKIFKQFVVPSLQAQTNQNFTLWVSWRWEERSNPQVIALDKYLTDIGLKHVFTYSGVCFYDDKHPDEIAKEKLINALHGAMGELVGAIGECSHVLMTIQPSDDTYWTGAADEMQRALGEHWQAFGYSRGYIMNYQTKEVKEYNPKTTPPFYTIKFPREVFINPIQHFNYTGIKRDVNQYKKGTPIPSHEYVGEALNYLLSNRRGFCVGTHFDNISTVFDHPYAGEKVDTAILKEFGTDQAEFLSVQAGVGKKILQKMPYKVKRKLRYWADEKKWILKPLFSAIYNLLRSI